MAEHGGYRQPANPAPVSGPGALSKRTDGKQPLARVPDAGYGEQAAYQAQQKGAPVAASPGGGEAAAGGPNINVIPFGAATQQPATPVTDGADAGAGVGLAALGLDNQDAMASREDLRWAAAALPVLEYYGNQPFASPGLRQLVRQIKGSMP